MSKKQKTLSPETQPSDFKIGQIYEWLPTPHSRFKVSFYAEIIFVDKKNKKVISYMPAIKGMDFSTYVIHDNCWERNMMRMRYVGMKRRFKSLLKNEQLLSKKASNWNKATLSYGK